MRQIDLVVIGSGAAGMAAAIEAKKNGVKDLLILEKQKEEKAMKINIKMNKKQRLLTEKIIAYVLVSVCSIFFIVPLSIFFIISS